MVTSPAGGGQASQQQAGERRRRASSLQLASPPVATRNGLARLLLGSVFFTHRFCYRAEKSKFDAEVLLTEHCRKHAVALIVVRPSIITNDRESGNASTFTHLNALVEVISRIQGHYRLSDGQVVSKRVRLLADPEARPNLAAVDSIIPPLLRIAGSSASRGKVFHLCHPEPQSNVRLVELICEAFKIKGKLALEFLESISRPMSRTEEMILRSLKPYAPYLNSRCEFDLSHSRSIVPDYDSYFTQLDVSYIQKIVEFQRRNRK